MGEGSGETQGAPTGTAGSPAGADAAGADAAGNPGTLRVTEVVIDCADHGRVVDFWAAALGYERRAVNEQYVALTPPERELGRPPLLFQKVPEPKTAKNRVHLDFRADVMADEVGRLVDLGATVIAVRSLDDFSWTVLADPDGNEFCVSGA